MRQLVPTSGRFAVVYEMKLGKIDKNPKIFGTNKIATPENYRKLFTWPGRAKSCVSFLDRLDGRGKVNSEKKNQNQKKCRGYLM